MITTTSPTPIRTRAAAVDASPRAPGFWLSVWRHFERVGADRAARELSRRGLDQAVRNAQLAARRDH